MIVLCWVIFLNVCVVLLWWTFDKPREFENYMGEFGMCGGYNPNGGGTPEVLFSCGTEAQCVAGLVFHANSFGKTGQTIYKDVFSRHGMVVEWSQDTMVDRLSS